MPSLTTIPGMLPPWPPPSPASTGTTNSVGATCLPKVTSRSSAMRGTRRTRSPPTRKRAATRLPVRQVPQRVPGRRSDSPLLTGSLTRDSAPSRLEGALSRLKPTAAVADRPPVARWDRPPVARWDRPSLPRWDRLPVARWDRPSLPRWDRLPVARWDRPSLPRWDRLPVARWDRSSLARWDRQLAPVHPVGPVRLVALARLFRLHQWASQSRSADQCYPW